LQLGEVDQAYALLAQAVELAPHQAAAQAAYAQAAARAGNYEAAHAAYLQAAELDASPAGAGYLREAGEALWALNRRAAAVSLWQRAVRAHPGDNYGLRGRLGLALLDLGQHEAALETLESAAQSAQDPALVRAAAAAALGLGKFDRAGEHLQGAI